MIKAGFHRISAAVLSHRKPNPPVPSKVWQSPLYFFAFGLGSGTMPVAPGTFGTLMAIPFYMWLAQLSHFHYLLFVVLFIACASWVCTIVSKEIAIDDHPGMCIDEFAGFFVTMLYVPYGLKWIILGFVLFRFFDIFKPWPIKYVDRNIHSGFGMVLDDVLAGLFSCALIQLIRYILT